MFFKTCTILDGDDVKCIIMDITVFYIKFVLYITVFYIEILLYILYTVPTGGGGGGHSGNREFEGRARH